MVNNKQRLEFIFGIIESDPVNGQDLIEELERTGKLDEAVAEFAKSSNDSNSELPAPEKEPGV